MEPHQYPSHLHMKDKALSITTNPSYHRCPASGLNHTHTHTRGREREKRERERRETFLKKDLFPSAAKSPAKRPQVSVCVQGVWGEKKEGEGRVQNGY